MDTLRWLLGAKRPCAHVEGDDVYPTHVADNIDGIRPFVMAWTMCFNDVLDADKLHDALCRLLEIGDWRKLGGRLRVGNGRTLEMHVPPCFTAERPAVAYTHETFDLRIAEHPLGSKLPSPTGDNASFWQGPDYFRLFATRQGAPETIDEFTCQDVLMLSLHITSFDDATLVAVSYPHTMMDAVGQRDLVHAWSLVLAGLEADVPPLLGTREDIMYKAGDPNAQPQEKYVLDSLRMSSFGMIKFGLRMLWDMFWNWQIECQTLFLPKKMVDDLRAEAMEELARDTPEGEEKPWVSDGDVLLGFFAHKSAQTGPAGRPMILMTPVDGRARLGDLIQKDGVYVQNMQLGCTAQVSASTAMGPPSGMALAYRRALVEQMSPEQALAMLRMSRSTWDSGGGTALFGPPEASLFITTNWARAKLMQAARFGPAVVRAGETGAGRTNPPGEMVFHHSQPLRPNVFARNVLGVLGKDHEGNYWVMGYFKPRTWELVREAVDGRA